MFVLSGLGQHPHLLTQVDPIQLCSFIVFSLLITLALYICCNIDCVPLCLPMQETWVLSLGMEDSLGKEIETHSTLLVWEISQTEETGRLQSNGLQKGRTRLGN